MSTRNNSSRRLARPTLFESYPTAQDQARIPVSRIASFTITVYYSKNAESCPCGACRSSCDRPCFFTVHQCGCRRRKDLRPHGGQIAKLYLLVCSSFTVTRLTDQLQMKCQVARDVRAVKPAFSPLLPQLSLPMFLKIPLLHLVYHIPFNYIHLIRSIPGSLIFKRVRSLCFSSFIRS